MPTSAPDGDDPSDDKLRTARRELGDELARISRRLQDRCGARTSSPDPDIAIEILRAAPPSRIRSAAAIPGGASDGGTTSARDYYRGGEGYRCKCAFQIVPSSSFADDGAAGGDADGDIDGATRSATNDDDLIYVTREGGKMRPLPNGIFPPANGRIRRAMTDLMECLNEKHDCVEGSSNYTFGLLRDSLTSVTFVTSWGDGTMVEQSQSDASDAEQSCRDCGGDCLVTLHYGPPGLPLPTSVGIHEKCDDALKDWKNDARILCRRCHFLSLTGRSKGIKIAVSGSTRNKMTLSGDKDSGGSIIEDGIIRDDLWLTLKQTTTCESSRVVGIEMVSLVPPTLLRSREDDAAQRMNNQQSWRDVRIQYQKPATAFQHPNAGVMLTSLHWILSTLSNMETPTSAAAVAAIPKRTKPRLLEMYCGCGAHTVPLAKSTILSEIVAVELDGRLVSACRNNCRLNRCLKENNNPSDGGDASKYHTTDDDRTLVQVFKGDSTEWAAKTLRRQLRQKNSSNCNADMCGYNDFDILLVDPPRDGLSPTVCQMALAGTFAHVIYVSCGRRALLRDLAILCDVGGFDVSDLAVVDLFPGTDAVESLVHLKRR